MSSCFATSEIRWKRLRWVFSWSSVIPSQPSQFDSSLPVQTFESRAQRRFTLPLVPQSSSTASTCAASSSGKVYVWRPAIASAGARQLASTAASSSAKASENRRTPSASSRSVTSFKETSSSARASSVACAPARPASSESRNRPCSRKASYVAGGIVFTVSGPMSSST